MTYRNEIGAQ